MKTSENQQSTSKEHETSDAPVAHSSTTEQQFKKPHPKLLNQLMKPSLSLTSLPPQSPKEVSDEAQSERPYNSLKVSKYVERQINEFWIIYIGFRKNAMAKRNFGVARGNRKLRSAQRPRTPAQAAGKMETTSGPPITSSWTRIWLIHVERRPARPTSQEMTSRENLKL